MSERSVNQSSPFARFFFSRIFPLPFVIVGALTLYFGCKNLLRAIESTTWPTAQGIIQQSKVEYHQNDDGAGTYHANVMYEFVVNGITYSSNRVAFGSIGSSNPSHARRIVNNYPKEKKVTVYYMRDNAEVCVLEPGIKGQSWLLPAFGLVFLVAGCLMLIFLPKQMRKKPTIDKELT